MTDFFALNMRRLVYFHHAHARDAAEALGVTPHAVSAWLTGKRRPNTATLLNISNTYQVDPRLLTDDPLEFAKGLGDPDRIIAVESHLEYLRRHGSKQPVSLAERRRRKT